MIAWALGARIGVGTFANAVLVGSFIDVLLAVDAVDELSEQALAVRIAALTAGILIVGLGSGLYLAAALGAGPRDSLMLVAASRTGTRIGIVRAALELVVGALGFALGGTVGVGTLAFALGIGPAVELGCAAVVALWNRAARRPIPAEARRSPVARYDRGAMTDPGPRAARMKGLVCAGGEATRLGELTRVTNKHLLPVGRWPMVIYPLQLLERAGAHDVLLVTGKGHAGQMIDLLGDGRLSVRGTTEPLLSPRADLQGADGGRWHRAGRRDGS